MWNARLDEAQAGIKITGRNINNLRYADETTLMAESEEDLKKQFDENERREWKSWLKTQPGSFSLVIGGRAGAVLKPDPTDTLYAIDALGCSASETVFVGDTSVDILTAKNAHVALSVGVAWGFRDRAELMDVGADIIIDEAIELLREIDKYEK